MKATSPLLRFTLFILVTVLLIYGVVQARDFLYPIIFGILIGYLLYPVVAFMEKHGIPRILANLIAIIFAIVLIGCVVSIFSNQLSGLTQDIDTLKKSADENIEKFQEVLQSFLGLKHNSIEDFLKSFVKGFFDNENGSIARIFSATTSTIFTIFILPVYVFLFLYYRTKFAYFILKLVKPNRKHVTLQILRDISDVIARYMGGVTIVVLILCIINASGLALIGVEYPILFGIISAIFNYIPYFGTLMGGAVPLLFTLFTAQDPVEMGFRVVVMYIIVQFTENNILTPNIVGGNVNVNPFFIIIGLVFGATLWGIPGMIVIVPFLAILRDIFKNINGLEPYAFLLGPGGTEKHALNFKAVYRKLFGKRSKAKDHQLRR